MSVLRTICLCRGRRILFTIMGSPTKNDSLSRPPMALETYGSERLRTLAQQLRLYKPPPTSIFDELERESEGIVSGVGFAESATPVEQRSRFKRAAVLVCLFEGEGGLRVILTRRSSTLSSHSGEISLPGGKADEGDANDEETATREAKEEIGLDPSLVNVVTVLEPFLSKVDILQKDPELGGRALFAPLGTSPHLLRVTPVIGILDDKNAFNPTPNAGEVDEIFDAPLEMFIKDENRRSEEREWMGYKYIIHYFDYETEGKKYLIWGLTAGILIRAASAVYQKPPAFQEQYPELKFPKYIKDGVMP